MFVIINTTNTAIAAGTESDVFHNHHDLIGKSDRRHGFCDKPIRGQCGARVRQCRNDFSAPGRVVMLGMPGRDGQESRRVCEGLIMTASMTGTIRTELDDQTPDTSAGDALLADGSYLARLTRKALLSPDQEVHLAKRVGQGGATARQARTVLIESNMRLVISVARMYRASGIALEDLVQEGVIGLMTAAERFDWRRGYRFSTYATQWIRQSIGRAVDNKAKSIRLPAHVSESLRKIERFRAEYRREAGEEPTPDIIAARTGLSLRKVNLLTQTLAEPVSLDMPVGDEDSATLGSILPDKNTLDPSETLIGAEMKTALYALLDALDERERTIMRRRFGFDGDGGAYVLQKIGEDMHISRERVRQIEAQALRKMRTMARQQHLREYLPG